MCEIQYIAMQKTANKNNENIIDGNTKDNNEERMLYATTTKNNKKMCSLHLRAVWLNGDDEDKNSLLTGSHNSG